MKKSNIKKFNKNFSSFFKTGHFWYDRNGVKKERPFDFSVKDGWFKIIYNLCKEIDFLLTEEERKNFKVLQMKEKFGGLRFYTANTPKRLKNKIYSLISKAESESFNICEVCGHRGKPRKDLSWIKTLCFFHYYKEKIVRKIFSIDFFFNLKIKIRKISRKKGIKCLIR